MVLFERLAALGCSESKEWLCRGVGTDIVQSETETPDSRTLRVADAVTNL